jgi:maltoporin
LYAHVKNASHVAHHDGCNDHVVLPMRYDNFASHATIVASRSSHAHGRSRPRRYVVSNTPKVRITSHGLSMLSRTFDASYVLYCKNNKIVASNVGPKCKKGKTCIWVPKIYLTNLVGPNKTWVPKSQD